MSNQFLENTSYPDMYCLINRLKKMLPDSEELDLFIDEYDNVSRKSDYASRFLHCSLDKDAEYRQLNYQRNNSAIISLLEKMEESKQEYFIVKLTEEQNGNRLKDLKIEVIDENVHEKYLANITRRSDDDIVETFHIYCDESVNVQIFNLVVLDKNDFTINGEQLEYIDNSAYGDGYYVKHYYIIRKVLIWWE